MTWSASISYTGIIAFYLIISTQRQYLSMFHWCRFVNRNLHHATVQRTENSMFKTKIVNYWLEKQEKTAK